MLYNVSCNYKSSRNISNNEYYQQLSNNVAKYRENDNIKYHLSGILHNWMEVKYTTSSM